MLLVNEQFKSINLNAQHVTGMTPFDSAVHTSMIIRFSR